MKKPNQAGFTIIELTIATAIFSVVLLIIAVGIMRFSTAFIKGVQMSQTQEVNRTVVAKITQGLQFATDFKESGTVSGWKAYCFGNYKYSFQVGVPVAASQHALVQSPLVSGAVCQPTTVFTLGTDIELLGDNMRINDAADFTITKLTGSSYEVHLRVTYGDSNLTDSNGRCKGGAGTQYCATSQLTTVVQRRL